MKKILALVLVLGVIGGLMAGCSGGEAAANANAPAPGAAAPAEEKK